MGFRGLWRERGFRRLYGTRLTSQFADGLVQVGLAAYVLAPENEATAGKVAAAFAVMLLPYSVLGPFAGVFLDRWRRQVVLVRTPLVRAVCVLGMAWLIAALDDSDLYLAAALVVLGVNRFFLSALSAALPHVVAEKDLLVANTVSVTSGTVAAFAGAALGFGIHSLGTTAVLAVAAVLYVAASFVARLLPRDGLGPDGTSRETVRNVVVGMVAGARYIVRRRPAARALGAIATHRFLYGIWLLMTLLLYRHHFPSGFGGVAVITTVSGGGYLVGALITPSAARRFGKDAWIAAMLLAAGASLLVLAVPLREPLYVAGGFALGVAAQGVKVCVDTILQESVADEFRGRVFAAYDMLFNATFVAAACVGAFTLPADGRSLPVLAGVIAAYAAAAVAYRALTRGGVTEPSGSPER
ncbi:MFS transporter [Actinocorallia sp. A-T 12471]|uniref:MFS transporter n=1 Tax=Actinocorallia sp. A-T 12471 TaxID=3089813 RepID=UPI0029D2CE68|nr:MFS transporter [Actinocorallia sp. A-T 12471]MDX6742728.1 MFS transporter [Actinocorallia sp. A-T 12471]